MPRLRIRPQKTAPTSAGKALIFAAVLVIAPLMLFDVFILYLLFNYSLSSTYIYSLIIPFPFIYFSLLIAIYYRMKGALSDKDNFIPAIFNFVKGTSKPLAYVKPPVLYYGVIASDGKFYKGKFYPREMTLYYVYQLKWEPPIPIPMSDQTFSKTFTLTPAPYEKCFRREADQWSVNNGMPVSVAGMWGVFDVLDVVYDQDMGHEGELVPITYLSGCHYTYLQSLNKATLIRPNREQILALQNAVGMQVALEMKLENKELKDHLAKYADNDERRNELAADRVASVIESIEMGLGKKWTKIPWKKIAIVIAIAVIIATIGILFGTGVFNGAAHPAAAAGQATTTQTTSVETNNGVVTTVIK